MNKKEIIVPAGIRFISEWKDYGFHLTPGKCIINKQITGCGFTEYYLTNNENVIIASPRIMLLRNKYEQHSSNGELDKVFLVRNPFDKDPGIDKNIQKEQRNVIAVTEEKAEIFVDKDTYNLIYSDLSTYINRVRSLGLPCKILVTYDSYHIVKDILKFVGIFEEFTTMVDEMQVVLDDSRFKSTTELKFMNALRDVEKVHFVSATPMLDKYLNMLDEFKNLDYYSINWAKEDPTRIMRPGLDIRLMRSVGETAKTIIQSYLSGEFERLFVTQNNKVTEIVSDEAVFYVNSVNHIISIIKNNGLTPNQVNILCSNTPENSKKIRKRLGSKFSIGSIPSRNEKPKMFTFCTRTVYLGADFYSKCARSFIFSDANIDCLSIDISLDLPQILGRQRLIENPWHNSAIFYYKTTADYRKMKKEDFDRFVEIKKSKTGELISAIGDLTVKERQTALMELYQREAKTHNYKYNYLSVNGEGNDKCAVFNDYTYVSDLRAFDIQQIDYKDRFSVFSEINKNESINNEFFDKICNLLNEYSKVTTIPERLKFICSIDSDKVSTFLNQLPDNDYAKQYYLAAGKEKCRALGYNITDIKKFITTQAMFDENLIRDKVLKAFNVGDIIIFSQAKQFLKSIYNELGYGASPKATDLEKWFDLMKTQTMFNGKRTNCYKVMGIKQ